MKIFIWKLLGLNIGKKVKIGLGVFLGNRKKIFIGNKVGLGIGFHIGIGEKGKLTIGDNTNINRFFTCGGSDEIKIGNNCLFSYNVSMHSGNHNFGLNIIPGTGEDKTAPIVIGDNCFIGCGAVILKGVNLGNNCVVGSNSVVTKSFEEGSVIGGNPAILIKKLK